MCGRDERRPGGAARTQEVNPRVTPKEKNDRVWSNIVVVATPRYIACSGCKNVKRYEVIRAGNMARR